MSSLKNIASPGKMLARILVLLVDYVRRLTERELLPFWVHGLLGDVQRSRCQPLVAREPAEPEAIGGLDVWQHSDNRRMIEILKHANLPPRETDIARKRVNRHDAC